MPVPKEDSDMEIFINMFICLSSKTAQTFYLPVGIHVENMKILQRNDVKQDTV